MSKVSRNLPDMPMPSFAYPDRHDGRVFILPIGDDGKKYKRTIGYMTVSTPGEERMVPNRYFRDTYQDLYMEAYPNEKIPAHQLGVGMYALTLGIVSSTGLYADLRDVYGPLHANSILDYAMFSILHKSGVTQVFDKTMANEVLFCDKLHGDSWYSDFFSKKLTEDQHHQLRVRWIRRLVENGLKKVWLSIDGSNNDCEARRSFLARFGFPKSHNRNKTIVGYMYVVDAQTGQPVTYFVYAGSVPDSQAFQKISVFLQSFHIDIEGVILDRGFAVENVFQAIEKSKWKYVIMLPCDVHGHTRMVKDHGEKIRWKSEHVLENEAMFGISDTKLLFGNGQRMSDICLFFDGAGGSAQSIRLIRQIQAAKRKAEMAIMGGNRASVEKKLQKYLALEGDGANRKVVIRYDNWNAAMAAKGFHSMAVSKGIGPSRANQLYGMRDTSETQYAILKSQEGQSSARVHKTEGIYSKFAVAFIASVIRHEIECACKGLRLDTNPTIQGLRQVALLYSANETYEAVRNLSTDQKALFDVFGVEQDDMERFAREYNKRDSSIKNPDRRLPDKKLPLIQPNTRKRGRHPMKEKASVMFDSAQSEFNDVSPAKSKGGRPKGSKDSKPRKPRSDKGKPRCKRTMK